jgi:hypothetical protein
MKNTGNRNGMPADVYARRVLDRIITRGDSPSEIWEGAQSWLLYFIVTWLPVWISVSRASWNGTRDGREHTDGNEQHKIFYAQFKLAKLRE